TQPQRWADEVEREAKRAMSTFEGRADDRGLSKGWTLLALLHMTKGRFALAAEAWERAADHAAAAGDRREELEHLAWVPIAGWCGPGTVEDGIRRCRKSWRGPKGIARRCRWRCRHGARSRRCEGSSTKPGRFRIGRGRSFERSHSRAGWAPSPRTRGGRRSWPATLQPPSRISGGVSIRSGGSASSRGCPRLPPSSPRRYTSRGNWSRQKSSSGSARRAPVARTRTRNPCCGAFGRRFSRGRRKRRRLRHWP